MMINCDVCKGRKRIIGLGNMQKDCPECRGIGWIEIPEPEKITLQDAMDNPKRKKKKPAEPVLQC